MENDWESKVDEWLSGETPRFIGKVWQVVVELEAERKFLGNRFKVPFYRKRFNTTQELETSSRTLIKLNSEGFIRVVGKELLKIGDESIFHNSKTEIELTGGFKYLYAWLDRRVHPEKFTSKFSTKAFLKQIFEKYEFTKKQKKLLYTLADGKPHKTKLLRNEVKTKDLATLKKTTLKKIKQYGLDKTLVIGMKRSQAIFAVDYYCQLEIHKELFKSYKNVIDKK